MVHNHDRPLVADSCPIRPAVVDPEPRFKFATPQRSLTGDIDTRGESSVIAVVSTFADSTPPQCRVPSGGRPFASGFLKQRVERLKQMLGAV